jgi:hypothetical protein
LISILSFNFRLSWNSTSWFFFHLTNDLFLLVIVIIFSFKIRFIYCRCFMYYIIEWTWICFFFKTCLQRPSIGFLHYRELYPVSGKARTTYLIKANPNILLTILILHVLCFSPRRKDPTHYWKSIYTSKLS